MTLYLQRPLDFGIDISVHSGDKIPWGPQRFDRRSDYDQNQGAGKAIKAVSKHLRQHFKP